MSNKISWRHHYLPVFYLEGFTNENNEFKIYNVQQNSFIKDGKNFSPKSYFFQKDGNTIYKNNIKDDFLETRFFAKMDSRIAVLFNKINHSESNLENRYKVSESDMPALNHFVSLMYWRLPHRKKEIDYILDKNALIDFGLSIENKNGERNQEEIDIEKRMKNDTEFRKGFKFYLSLIDSIKGVDFRTPYTIISTPEELPGLCSDNPLIFRNEKIPDVFKDDYIMPISRNRLFFRKNDGKSFKIFEIKLLIDLLIYKQAVKYVSCTDEKYIQILDDFYKANFSSTLEIREMLFNKIS